MTDNKEPAAAAARDADVLDFVTLITDDRDELECERIFARRCGALDRALSEEQHGLAEGEEEGVLYVSDVSMWALQLIIDYCQFDFPGCENIRPTIPDYELEPLHHLLSAQPVDASVLCELASASYQLDCRPLVEATCKAIAGTIKGRSTEEIRRIFSIVNDFSPAEEEEVRREVLEHTMLLPSVPIEEEVEDEDECCNTPLSEDAVNAAEYTSSDARDKLRVKLLERHSLQHKQQEVCHNQQKIESQEDDEDEVEALVEDKEHCTSEPIDTPIAQQMTVDELVAFIEADESQKKTRRKRGRRRRCSDKDNVEEELVDPLDVSDAVCVNEALADTPSPDLTSELTALPTSSSTQSVGTSTSPTITHTLCASCEPSSSSSSSHGGDDNTCRYCSLDVRLSSAHTYIETLEQQMRTEQMVRKMLEARVIQNESELVRRVHACEQTNRQLETRLKQEALNNAALFRKLERRQTALEGLLVSPTPPHPSPHTLMLAPAAAHSTHLRPTQSRRLFQTSV